MSDYSVYDGCLRSEIAFAFLPTASREPTWTLSRSLTPPPADCLEQLGDDDVGETLTVRSFRRADGMRLEYDDTGTFDIESNGARIVWYPGGASTEAVQLDVLGRVLPMAMHMAGAFCLHASAVELGTGAVGFLAPSGHGKSTLAQALVAAGARLVTDDVAAIDVDPEPRMRPGVPNVRLRRDSARHLGQSGAGSIGPGGKLLIASGDAAAGVQRRLPLAALYLLESVPPAPQIAPVRRSRIVGVSAAIALVTQARLARLLGGSGAASVLGRASRLAGAAPIFALQLARDFGALREAADSLIEWHGGLSTPSGKARSNEALRDS